MRISLPGKPLFGSDQQGVEQNRQRILRISHQRLGGLSLAGKRAATPLYHSTRGFAHRRADHRPTELDIAHAQNGSSPSLIRQLDEIPAAPFSLREIVARCTNVAEREAIVEALLRNLGNKAKAARTLKIDYKTMQTKVKKYGLNLNQKEVWKRRPGIRTKPKTKHPSASAACSLALPAWWKNSANWPKQERSHIHRQPQIRAEPKGPMESPSESAWAKRRRTLISSEFGTIKRWSGNRS